MKTAAKVFTIIGMVVGFWWIVPIVIGALTLKKLKTAQKKDELTLWGVLTLLLCSPIAGILLLCMKDAHLEAPAVAAEAPAAAAEEAKAEAPSEETL